MTQTDVQTWKFDQWRSLPPGPWHDEPDKMVWVDPDTGLDCMVRRGGGGALCGYVGVPESHPWFGADVFSYDTVVVDVHGGLTFGAPCPDEHDDEGICHVALPGRPDKVFWLGFDCGHYMDVAPGRGDDGFSPGAAYRDLEYVRNEVTQLARQCAAVA